MAGDFSLPVSVALDKDGFLRRECPNCERQFKWFHHDKGDPEAEVVDQFFCPFCGVPAETKSWWTQAQIEYIRDMAAPEIQRYVRDALTDASKGMQGVSLRLTGDYAGGLAEPEPLTEADDMVIVEPPCHPNEPLKVPVDLTQDLHCLVCGRRFAA
jgi:hypothetical protein